MEIVKAKEEHLEEVAGMYFEEFKEFYNSKQEAMEEVKQKQKDGTLFVGMVDGKVAGCFGYVRSWTHGANYLEGIVVKKEFRGQGLSKPMLEKFIQVSRDEQQNDFVISSTSKNNEVSRIVHKKMGFEECCTFPGLHFGEDEVFFRLKIK